jgi:hypothetical protein
MLYACCGCDSGITEFDAYDWDSEWVLGWAAAGLVPLDGSEPDICTKKELEGLLVRVLGDFAILDVCYNQFRAVECAYATGFLD